jgi:hypothetical protein
MADDYDDGRRLELNQVLARLEAAERRLRRQGRVLWVLAIVAAVGVCGAGT